MSTRTQAVSKERTMRPTAAGMVRWTGLAAMGAGLLFVGIQPIHPPDVLASVTTSTWAIIQSLKLAMCFLFLVGITGLYARQVEAMGWLGLAGFLLFSLTWVIQVPFIFTQLLINPLLATASPAFVESFLGIINGHPGEMNLGVLPALYMLNGLGGYLLGGLLFGIATFRAGILPRWAGGLLAFGVALPLLASSLVPHPFDRIFAVPVGLAVVWLGYALWSERRAHAAQPAPGTTSPQLRHTGAE